ncbi:hypothetical protein CONCODRAFT_69632 [Conidiobolus coronatus NRRL 28638]|uniref:NADH:ubiquinone reductase (non-electrogenic) n=1 Tax=Conidiobolus coronatus (strain ATCC 28846 / CBS 209.66 / NRRL 28638) TaxID=796925 RepID=A0A137P9N5_CONC2|nr:hypothetical protein CONCODRAFT_69632 [Conidiobolus coronatus NRRL 28638]|eukprot:KXN71692.1 hypothetical protein CONCODRAFT_69632 [Conidiobolus coronatus NRRL 28638]
MCCLLILIYIDFKGQTLSYVEFGTDPNTKEKLGKTLQFDKIIVSVGETPNDQGVKGVYEHALFMNQLPDASKLYKTVLDRFEEASRIKDEEEQKNKLHFIVVGGGQTGVETAGELRDLLVKTMANHYPKLRDKIQLTLFHRPEGVLNRLPESLSDFTMQHLKKSGINLVSDKSVVEITERYVKLSDNTQIGYGGILWATGNKSVPLVQKLGDQVKIESGKLLVNSNLKLLDNDYNVVSDNCFAIGDCSYVRDGPASCTAAAANMEAAYLTKALNSNKFEKPFEFKHMGSLAYLGNKAAVADLNGSHMTGRKPALLWSVAYWAMSANSKTMIYIPYYWMKTRINGKSLTPIIDGTDI